MTQAWRQFFSMGGYAWYVWSSYLLVLVILCNSWLDSIRQHNAQLKLARFGLSSKDVDE